MLNTWPFPSWYHVAQGCFPASYSWGDLTLTCSRDTRIFLKFPLVSSLTSDSRLLSNTFEEEKRKEEAEDLVSHRHFERNILYLNADKRLLTPLVGLFDGDDFLEKVAKNKK